MLKDRDVNGIITGQVLDVVDHISDKDPTMFHVRPVSHQGYGIYEIGEDNTAHVLISGLAEADAKDILDAAIKLKADKMRSEHLQPSRKRKGR